jgi:hypothetical protein
LANRLLGFAVGNEFGNLVGLFHGGRLAALIPQSKLLGKSLDSRRSRSSAPVQSFKAISHQQRRGENSLAFAVTYFYADKESGRRHELDTVRTGR